MQSCQAPWMESQGCGFSRGWFELCNIDSAVCCEAHEMHTSNQIGLFSVAA
jgi:hypothetical protein